MRGRGNFMSQVYEPTPDERERERQGHREFLIDNNRSLEVVKERLQKINSEFKRKNKKLYEKIALDLNRARMKEASSSAKLDKISLLESESEKILLKIKAQKRLDEKNKYEEASALKLKEDTVNKQTTLNKGRKTELVKRLLELKKVKKETDALNIEANMLNKDFKLSEIELSSFKKTVSEQKRVLSDEIIKQRVSTKELRDKIQQNNILINNNIKCKLRLEKDKEKSDELLDRLKRRS